MSEDEQRLQFSKPALHWLIFTGLTVFAVFLLMFFGLAQKMAGGDRTFISSVITLLYLGTCAHCWVRLVAVRREADLALTAAAILNGPEAGLLSGSDDDRRRFVACLPGGHVAAHVRDLVEKSTRQGAGRLDQTLLLKVLAGRLRASNPFGAFMSDVLVKLGLLGTIIGFILMLAPIAGIDSDNQGALKASMALMSDGMGIAMYTTLAGLAGSLLLKVQYHFLDDATNRLFAFALGLTEVHVVSALERARGHAP